MTEQVTKSRLFIKKIEINNCKRFYGEGHSIDFSEDPKKNVTVIIGSNGLGKTSIHNIIYWGLYGKFKSQDNDTQARPDYGLVNNDALMNLGLGKATKSSVKIYIHDENGENMVIERTLTARKTSESNEKRFEARNNSQVPKGVEWEEDVSLMNYVDGKQQLETNINIINNEIGFYFPIHLSDFILFDGEQLKKFKEPSTNTSFIKDGITKISNSGIINKIYENAKESEKSISKTMGSKSLDLTPYQVRKEETEKNVDELKKKIIDLNKEKIKFKTQSNEYAEKIKATSTGKDLIKEEKEVDKDITRLRKELNEVKSGFKDFIFENLPIVLLRDSLKNTEKIYAKLEQEDKIPPSISRGAIEKILNSVPLKCVCGREFEKSDDEKSPWKILNAIKDILIDDTTSSGITLGRNLMERMVDSTNHSKLNGELSGYIKKRKDIRDNIREALAKKEILSNQIQEQKTIDDVDYGKLKVKADEEYERTIGEITTKEAELAKAEKEFLLADTEFTKMSKIGGKFDAENLKISFLKKIMKFSERLEKRVEDKLRIRVQNSTHRHFHEVFKNAGYGIPTEAQEMIDGKVEIDKNFVVTVKDQYGNQAELSQGQGHILGLAYITGIREITNINSFIVIDSPLHNISDAYRNEIAKTMLNNLQNVQLIFIVTDSEYLNSKPGSVPVRKIFHNSNMLYKDLILENQTTDGVSSREIKEYKENV